MTHKVRSTLGSLLLPWLLALPPGVHAQQAPTDEEIKAMQQQIEKKETEQTEAKKKVEAEAKRKAEAEAKRKAEEAAKQKEEDAAKAAEGERKKQEVEAAKKQANEEAKQKAEAEQRKADEAKKQAEVAKQSSASAGEFVDIPGRNFRMGKYDVTFAQWDACVTAGGCNGYKPEDHGWGRGNRPVINVSFDDAHKFIDWLNSSTGQHYRLPTEEEWEYAARGGTTTDYYWGNDVGSGNANCNGCGSQWDGKQTAPVGSFKPNPYGLYDMLGNVWQWTESCYENDCGLRVWRGGSWFIKPAYIRVSFRGGNTADSRGNLLGFRLAQDK